MAAIVMEARPRRARAPRKPKTAPVESDALCPEDEIEDAPPRVGRPVRAMPDGYARGSAGHAPKCRECPQWVGKTSVCPLRGAHQNGQSPACRYGIVLIRAKRMADRRAGTESTKGVKKQCRG